MNHPPEAVLNQQPADLLVWVQRRLSGELPSEPMFNWHGLAEVAAMNASESDASPAWAEVAVNVYSWLASRSNAPAAASFTFSEMLVRAGQISVHGACSGHSLRDPKALLAWFHHERRLSLAEASALAMNWEALPVSEIAKLRHIKNMLAPLVVALNRLAPADREELQGWVELRPRLP